MKELKTDIQPPIPSHGSDVRRFLPFTDATTGKLNWPLPAPEKIEVKIDKKLYLPETCKIIALSSGNDHVTFYCEKEEEVLKYRILVVRNTLMYYDEWLFPYGFLRIHESFIINIRHLVYKEGNEYTLTRKLNIKLTESRSYKDLCERAFSIFRKP
jgi:DNA-binding LytR/AlgR family response regulator